MTKRRRGAFPSGHRGMPPPGGKGPKGKRSGRRARNAKTRNADSLREQPVLESDGAVPCRICGYPVHPKRMHFHMVRFHGAAFRSPPP